MHFILDFLHRQTITQRVEKFNLMLLIHFAIFIDGVIIRFEKRKTEDLEVTVTGPDILKLIRPHTTHVLAVRRKIIFT